jgi:hypothetical protein
MKGISILAALAIAAVIVQPLTIVPAGARAVSAKFLYSAARFRQRRAISTRSKITLSAPATSREIPPSSVDGLGAKSTEPVENSKGWRPAPFLL